MNSLDRLTISISVGVPLGLCALAWMNASRLQFVPPPPALLAIDPSTLIRGSTDFLGDVRSPCTIVEFADYQCPPCVSARSKVAKLLDDFRGKVRFLYRHMPLPAHSSAKEAAILAEGARLQGKFWRIHHALFGAEGQLDGNRIRAIAERSGLDSELLKKDSIEKAASIVAADVSLARQLGVRFTPTFFFCDSDNRVLRLGALEQAVTLLAPKKQ